MYFEDVALGAALRALGQSLIWLPWVRVTHDAGSSSGGASGSIIGRNSFQRPREDALKLLGDVVRIYQGKF